MVDDEFIFPDFDNPAEELSAMLLEWIQRELRPLVAELVPPNVAARPTMAGRLIDKNISTILHVVARWFDNDGPTPGTGWTRGGSSPQPQGDAGTEPGQ